MCKCFKKIGNTDYISFGKSKGLFDEIIKPSSTSENSVAPALSYLGKKIRVKFDGSCIKHDKITFIHRKTLTIYIVYETNLQNYVDSSDPSLGNFLFGAIKSVKSSYIDKYKFSGYGIGFHMKGTFSFPW